MGMDRGIRAAVLWNAEGRYGARLSSRVRSVTVLGVAVPPRYAPSPVAPAVWLDRTNGATSLVAPPPKGRSTTEAKHGGNFAWSDDPLWPAWTGTEAPVPVFDNYDEEE